MRTDRRGHCPELDFLFTHAHVLAAHCNDLVCHVISVVVEDQLLSFAQIRGMYGFSSRVYIH
jgi:hypothetical protein